MQQANLVRASGLAYPFLGCHGVTAATSMSGPNDSFNLALHTGGNIWRALKNRRLFFKSLRISPEEIVCLNQIHGARVIIAGKKHAGCGATTHATAITGDAVITDIPGLPIAIFTADCLPILIFDRAKKIIGLVHAGWRGAAKGILARTLAAMKKRFQSKPRDIIITNGPYISGCCYEVSKDFGENFRKAKLEDRKGRTYLDLFNSTIAQALDAGIPPRNIRHRKICTMCGKGFFSYRRDGTSSRMATVMVIQQH